MRLKKEQIQKIAELVLKGFKEKKLATFKVSEEKILNRIQEIILKDLRVESDLDEEVKTMMEKYKAQISSGQIDYQKMFQMIKKQLIKDRGLVV